MLKTFDIKQITTVLPMYNWKFRSFNGLEFVANNGDKMRIKPEHIPEVMPFILQHDSVTASRRDSKAAKYFYATPVTIKQPDQPDETPEVPNDEIVAPS